MHATKIKKYKYLKVKLGQSTEDWPQSALGIRRDNSGVSEELQRLLGYHVN